MPRDFNRVISLGPIDRPSVVLGNTEMDVIEAEHLAAGHHCQRQAIAVQFGT